MARKRKRVRDGEFKFDFSSLTFSPSQDEAVEVPNLLRRQDQALEHLLIPGQPELCRARGSCSLHFGMPYVIYSLHPLFNGHISNSKTAPKSINST